MLFYTNHITTRNFHITWNFSYKFVKKICKTFFCNFF